MSPQNPGPPPVSRAVAVAGTGRAAEQFLVIQETLKADRGAEAKAIQAMFGGDKDLMNRFLAVAFAALASNNDLLSNATAVSIIQSVKDAAALGLEPTGLLGEGAIVRYGDQAQFQPMYRGYLKRIRNSHKVVDIDCQIVYMNDEFSVQLGTEPSINHVPLLFGEKDEATGEFLEERGGYRGAYAWALMPSGKYIIEWMPEADINAVRDHFSRAHQRKPNDSPWATSWPEMARKTVIRRLAKRLPGEAVDQLLLADAQADNAAAALHEATVEANKGVTALRTMALRATGQLPAPAPDEAGDEAQGQPTESSEPEAQCAAASPYGDGQVCLKVAGHDGNHQGADKSTWS